MTRPSIAQANSARAEARRQRAEALIGVAQETLTVDDFIRYACTESGRPLLKVSLRQLLMAQPGWGEAKARHLIEHTVAVHGTTPPKRVTLGWLLDSRADGKRFMAYADAGVPKDDAPWIGFPSSPSPVPVTPNGGTR